ncbi:bifunctional methylenetetrahydrofolate dehydrogenase/methenyltetrahydrofolate cyclohydrolase FolD [Armatimonas sp.]|uniref:bifunctional methylenetetrahydrofolate dehydrogenase/methenyltetrahydrofolate cyclohydrolase FolD n=1 Tax=Armatimonas sp. TaxID=1872638 RepID=UPI00374DCCC3
MSEPLILDGATTAKAIRAEVATRTATLKEAHGITPGLAAVLAGDNPASITYVSMKRKACAKAGITSFEHVFGSDATQEEVLACIHNLNADPTVHGILVQHPMPKGLDEDEILAAVDPAKDVDGIGRASLGDLVLGHPSFVSCTPQGMMTLMKRYGIDPAGKHAVVIGRSVILGKPMAIALLNANATVTICHSKTRNLAEFTRQADILVAAVGRPELITGDMLKPGVVVLDAGYNRVEGRGHDVGDCHFESCAAVASAITPVPGGVGPMTIATLLEQTVIAAERSVGK